MCARKRIGRRKSRSILSPSTQFASVRSPSLFLTSISATQTIAYFKRKNASHKVNGYTSINLVQREYLRKYKPCAHFVSKDGVLAVLATDLHFKVRPAMFFLSNLCEKGNVFLLFFMRTTFLKQLFVPWQKPQEMHMHNFQ